MKLFWLVIFSTACFCPADASAYPQAVSKLISDDPDARSPLALVAARAEYIYRLEKLLALQESDLQTNKDYLEENRTFLEQDKRFEPYLKAFEVLIQSSKGLIQDTRKLLAQGELLSLTEDDYRDSRLINRHKEPYNLVTLLRILKLNALPEAEIRAAIEKRGVDFDANDFVESELVNAGASNQLLALISSSYRR